MERYSNSRSLVWFTEEYVRYPYPPEADINIKYNQDKLKIRELLRNINVSKNKKVIK